MIAAMTRSVPNWIELTWRVITCVLFRRPATVEDRVLGRMRHARAHVRQRDVHLDTFGYAERVSI
jgi:hypothetical protein